MSQAETQNIDPSTIQTAAGLSSTLGIETNYNFTKNEAEVLRSLAGQVAELAERPEEDRKKKAWTAHNDLQSDEPLLFCDPENGWNEIIQQKDLKCSDPLARVWEMHLRKEIFWALHMKDDKVIEPYFNVPYNYTDSGWGLKEKKVGGTDGGSYTWEPPIQDWERDFPLLRFPEIKINREETSVSFNLASSIFGDLLTVRLRGIWWWTMGMTWDFINLRGLENFMFDLYDHPDWVHRAMAFMRDGTLAKIDFLENNGLLALNTEGSYVGSGGFGWTNELPALNYQADHVRTVDMWGFAESQETVGIATEMFAEFVLPYQLPILDRFGLNCYGCCEPIDVRWEEVKKIPRLRRVSASPWANRARIKEQLGNDYIISIKPSPTPLAQYQMDEDLVRTQLKADLKDTKGGVVEFIMKDNHTLGGNPKHASRWVEIAREEIARLG
ncbi:hypothetical protein MASR2M78_14300 [Treponema sp.]